MYKEFQNGAIAKSYITNSLLIYREIFAHFLIYVLGSPFFYMTLQLLLIYEEKKKIFFIISETSCAMKKP